MQETLLEKNLQALSEDLRSLIRLSPPVGDVFPSKTGVPTFKIKDIIFHSAHDPIKEANRLIDIVNNEGGKPIIGKLCF